MKKVLKQIKQLKKKNSERNISGKHLTAAENQRLFERYKTLLKEYSYLITIELLLRLPIEVQDLFVKIPEILFKTTLYGHALMPNKVTIYDFVEHFIDELAENAQLIDIVVRRISEDGLTIELPGESLIQNKVGGEK
jgi:hypothetical protein